MTPVIRRGQSVRWRMTIPADGVPADMTGGTWAVAETSFVVLPTFENCGTEAWLVWTPEQTRRMTVGRKKLRLQYTQPNGAVRIYPDAVIMVQ